MPYQFVESVSNDVNLAVIRYGSRFKSKDDLFGIKLTGAS